MEMSPAERHLNNNMGRAFLFVVPAHECFAWADDVLDGLDWLWVMGPCEGVGSGLVTVLAEELPPGWTGPVELIQGGPALLARLQRLANNAVMANGSRPWLELVATARVPLPFIVVKQEGRRVDFGQVGLQDERG